MEAQEPHQFPPPDQVERVEYYLVDGRKEFLVVHGRPGADCDDYWSRSITRPDSGAFASELASYFLAEIPIDRYELDEETFLKRAQADPVLENDYWVNERRRLKAIGFEGERTDKEKIGRYLSS